MVESNLLHFGCERTHWLNQVVACCKDCSDSVLSDVVGISGTASELETVAACWSGAACSNNGPLTRCSIHREEIGLIADSRLRFFPKTDSQCKFDSKAHAS
jgi:hypothetical protein